MLRLHMLMYAGPNIRPGQPVRARPLRKSANSRRSARYSTATGGQVRETEARDSAVRQEPGKAPFRATFSVAAVPQDAGSAATSDDALRHALRKKGSGRPDRVRCARIHRCPEA